MSLKLNADPYVAQSINVKYKSLSVCLFEHISGTPWPICLKFWLGNSGRELREFSGFEKISWVGRLFFTI